MKNRIYIIAMLLLILVSCGNKNENVVKNSSNEITKESENAVAQKETSVIDVKFSIAKVKKYDNKIVEDTEALKKEGKKHSVKYYSYQPEDKPEGKETFPYFDVVMNQRYLAIDDSIKKNEYKWENEVGVFSKTAPNGYKMSYGIDVSKHNGNIDFKKVKEAGFEFAFIRIAYRGYGKAGNLKEDEMYKTNLKNAKDAGLKIGAYVFSQAKNEEEAVDEARFAIKLLKGYELDLPLVFDPETIRNDVARTDDISGEQFTKNAIAFLEEIKKEGYAPAIYSNLVWQDYYFDLSKLKDYEIWYADYSKLPQTPYDFTYWQFSERGIVDGVKGEVDLNVMIEKRVD